MTGDNRFVFVAPMYNASAYVGQMLASVVGQSYTNWQVILIDDVSDRDEVIKESEIIQGWQHLIHEDGAGLPEEKHRIRVIWNDEKRWEVANVLTGIGMCKPDDIVCRLDADDWLTELDALVMLNEAYKQLKVDALWTAHRWGFSDKNISGNLPSGADPYNHPWVSSHLKTFRKRLLEGVPYENFTNESGELVRRAGDQAVYLPALKNAKTWAYIPRVMYHYTINDVPETYQTDDARFQRDEAIFLRQRGYVSTGEPWENKLHT